MVLEIVSYNIQYGKNIKNVEQWVGIKEPDIVNFQEYPEDELCRFAPQYNEIFAGSFNKGSRTFGELIIYKPELVLQTAYGINLGAKNKNLLSSAVGRRSALVASFQTETGKLVLANIHLEWLARARYKLAQLGKVFASIDDAFPDPDVSVVVVGDCNFSNIFSGNDLEVYANQRGYAMGPRTNTHRLFGVHHQVDYVMYKGCRVERVRAENTTDSDHRPVLFTLIAN